MSSVSIKNKHMNKNITNIKFPSYNRKDTDECLSHTYTEFNNQILILEKHVGIIKKYVKETLDSYDSNKNNNIKEKITTDYDKNNLEELYSRLNTSFITLWEIYNNIN